MKRKSVLYMEISESIKNDIQNNVYLVGEMLPTETEFEEMFKVSKITIRKAIEVLSLQGYVEKKSGKGTTVLSNRLFNKLSKGDSFSTVLEKKGFKIAKRLVEIEKLAIDQEHKYYEYFGETVTKITRMYDIDEQPYIIFNHYLPGSVYQQTKEKLATTSMYRILADENFLVDHFQDQFSVTVLGAAEKNVLKTTESHGMKRVRRGFNRDNQVIEVSVSVYNTNLYPYEIEFEI